MARPLAPEKPGKAGTDPGGDPRLGPAHVAAVGGAREAEPSPAPPRRRLRPGPAQGRGLLPVRLTGCGPAPPPRPAGPVVLEFVAQLPQVPEPSASGGSGGLASRASCPRLALKFRSPGAPDRRLRPRRPPPPRPALRNLDCPWGGPEPTSWAGGPPRSPAGPLGRAAPGPPAEGLRGPPGRATPSGMALPSTGRGSCPLLRPRPDPPAFGDFLSDLSCPPRPWLPPSTAEHPVWFPSTTLCLELGHPLRPNYLSAL